MDNIIHARNCIYQTNYHIVWIPKYRRKILNGEVRQYTIDLIHSIAKEKDYKILALEVCEDHLHLFVSFPPSVSIATVIKHFKGISARKLLMRYPEIRYKKESLWAPSYYVGTAEHVSSETIKKYIEHAQRRTYRR